MTIVNIPNLGKRGKEKQNREQETYFKDLESANKKQDQKRWWDETVLMTRDGGEQSTPSLLQTLGCRWWQCPLGQR